MTVPPEIHDLLGAQQAQIDELRAELAAVRRASAPRSPAVSADEDPRPTEQPRAVGIGRRRALRAAAGLAAGAAAGVATAVSAAPAAAADGSALILGSAANGATSPTGLTAGMRDMPYGFAVTDFGLGSYSERAAVLGHANSTAFDIGLHGFAPNDAIAVRATANRGTGVFAWSISGSAVDATSRSGVGVRGDSESNAGVLGRSVDGPGGQFSTFHDHGVVALSAFRTAIVAGGPASIRLVPQRGADHPSELAEGSDLDVGDVASLATGPSATITQTRAWICVDGSSQTWRVLAGPDSAGSLHLLPRPVRVYDSRAGTVPAVGAKTPLVADQERVLDLRANASGVPAGATGAVLTILLVNAASGAGNFTVWAGNVLKPQSNTMVWGGSAGRFCTTALTALDAYARVRVAASLRTDLVVDVVGYYR